MNVEIPEDVSKEELKEIENVLAQSIATSLGCDPEQLKVTVDPETGIATFVVTTNDPLAAEQIQEVLKNSEDFAENVNKVLRENSQDLPARIREDLAVQNVNVNSLFQNNHNKRKQFPELQLFSLKICFQFSKTTKLGFQHSAKYKTKLHFQN